MVATNRDLDELIETDRFRKDLYYRLAIHEIVVPPLSERKEDIPLLLRLFTEEATEKLSEKMLYIPPELVPLLETYHFPGNIRELRSMIFDAVSKRKSKRLSLAPFRESVGKSAKRVPVKQAGTPLIFSERLPTIRQATELLVEEAMKRAQGNQSIAATLLGISHQALNKRLLRKERE